MSFSVENGYSPRTNEDLVNDLVNAVNEEYGETYTPETIVGSNIYKLYYPALQIAQGVENGISQIGNKAQDYVTYINDKIKYPKSSPNGIMQALENDLNVIASIAPITTPDKRGTCDIACDVDTSAEDYQTLKQNIINKIGQCATTGLVYSGSETGFFTGINGQKFPISYAIPTVLTFNIKIAITVSRNTTEFIPAEVTINNLFRELFNQSYRLGKDFEPDSYLCKERLPWSSSITVTYQNGSGSFTGEVFKSAYNQKIVLGTVNAEIIDE